MVHWIGRPETGPATARYLGQGEHTLGHCNTAEATPDPSASHARCGWVYWAKQESGWKTCRCSCHPTGHEANEQVRDAIHREVAREEQRTMAETEAAEKKAAKKTTAKKAATKKAKAPVDCMCGCGGQTKGGRFLPGHDAKLKSKLQAQYREAKTKAQRDKVAKQFDALGWSKFVPVLTED